MRLCIWLKNMYIWSCIYISETSFLRYTSPDWTRFPFLNFSLPDFLVRVRAINIKICTCILKATFHLTISVRGQRATGKIQRNNYYHRSCGPSLTDKTMSVFLIFTQGTHRNVKNR